MITFIKASGEDLPVRIQQFTSSPPDLSTSPSATKSPSFSTGYTYPSASPVKSESSGIFFAKGLTYGVLAFSATYISSI
ncbi:hypothetical protein K7432_000679 [Basidiobolus ranarum]|uniref:Uncharacterized protein n=1 Tax=Basidiobolus ranarum TaxID=34480 RepID=A0ABR2WAT8_9FUNG